MLLHFEDYVNGGRHGEAIAHDAKGLIDRRHGAFDELYVDGGAGDLDYVSDIFSHNKVSTFSSRPSAAKAAKGMLVIAAPKRCATQSQYITSSKSMLLRCRSTYYFYDFFCDLGLARTIHD